MGIRKSVFGSKSERHNYDHLCRQWGEKYCIYHNLPFLNIFTFEKVFDFNLRPMTLTDLEMSRLKKTSIDFTLCDKNDTPILCVEFDGMNDGYNVGQKYLSERQADAWRETIMALKLKVAHGSLFPFVIVGSPQFKQIGENIQLTIVDGIIGDILASRAASKRFSQGFNPEDLGVTREVFNGLSETQKDEVVQDWVWGVEIESDLENNPIYSKCAELENELMCSNLSVRYVSYPVSENRMSLVQRRSKIPEPMLQGATVSVKDPIIGEKSATVMLPNFQTIGVSPISLSEEIAHLIVLNEIKRKRPKI